MAYELIEDQPAGLITIRFSDRLTDAEMLSMMDELYQLEIHSFADQLLDFSEVSSFDITFDGANNYHEVATERREPQVADKGRFMAILAPSDLAFGMSRLMASLASKAGFQVMVFRTRAETVSYLNRRAIEEKKPQKSQF